MERLIDKIREKYPAPVGIRHEPCGWSHDCVNKNHYCVQGAHRMFIGLDADDVTNRFPDFYNKISEANDSGNFELAWELLAQAIEGNQ